MKPNIFRLAKRKLPREVFFIWLLQWADNSQGQYNEELNETAKDFIRLLLGQTQDYQITKVVAGRQMHNLDIWAEVNDAYFIGIEHEKYVSEFAEGCNESTIAHYKIKNQAALFVYLKGGNESLSTLHEIKENGYIVIDRKTILAVLNRRPIANEIFNDFKDHLTAIESAANAMPKPENPSSDYQVAEGFYLKLQE